MEGLHCLRDLLSLGDWMYKIDLKDAYFSINLSEKSEKFVRFYWEGSLYEFNCLYALVLVQNFYETLKDSNIYIKKVKHKSDNLRRRFVNVGLLKRRTHSGQGYNNFPATALRFCDKSEKMCIATSTKDKFPGADCEF